MTAPASPVAEMLQRHRERLLSYVKRQMSPELGARLDAEDVLQDAYLDAVADYGRYLTDDTRMSEYVWLYLKARDRLHEAERAARAGCRDVGREAWKPDASSFAFGPIDSATGPVSAAQREEMNQAFHAVLDQLPATDREVLWLRDFDLLSHAEIGELLGITENASGARYHRAIKAFEKLLREQFPHWSSP